MCNVPVFVTADRKHESDRSGRETGRASVSFSDSSKVYRSRQNLSAEEECTVLRYEKERENEYKSRDTETGSSEHAAGI